MLLKSFDYIVVNSSAGKDSQAMLDHVFDLCNFEHLLDRLIVLHCDLGEEEWPGTLELAQEHAEHYGVRFEVVKRRCRPLLEEIRKRGKWPSATQRYCTSYYKRDQAMKLYTKISRELWKRRHATGRHQWPAVKILNCLGFRAEESPARAKRPELALNERASNNSKEVWDWLPIHQWTEKEVWSTITAAGTRPHYAYALGMTRLSCRFCIFAPPGQLAISARHNPELFARYLAVEKEIGHTFRAKFSLQMVEDLVQSGADVADDDGCWNM